MFEAFLEVSIRLIPSAFWDIVIASMVNYLRQLARRQLPESVPYPLMEVNCFIVRATLYGMNYHPFEFSSARLKAKLEQTRLRVYDTWFIIIHKSVQHQSRYKPQYPQIKQSRVRTAVLMTGTQSKVQVS